MRGVGRFPATENHRLLGAPEGPIGVFQLNLAVDCVCQELGLSGYGSPDPPLVHSLPYFPLSSRAVFINCPSIAALGCALCSRNGCSSDRAPTRLRGSFASPMGPQFGARIAQHPLPCLENQKCVGLASFHWPPDHCMCPQPRPEGPEACEQKTWACCLRLLLPPKHQLVLVSFQKS